MVDIMTALATASQAIKLANELRGIDKAIDAAEYKLKIADLTVALSDIKLALSEARDIIASKQAEIDELKKQAAVIQDTIEHAGFKYAKRADGTPKGRPFCPVCVAKLNKLFPLTNALDYQLCPNCKGVYQGITVFTD